MGQLLRRAVPFYPFTHFYSKANNLVRQFMWSKWTLTLNIEYIEYKLKSIESHYMDDIQPSLDLAG